MVVNIHIVGQMYKKISGERVSEQEQTETI